MSFAVMDNGIDRYLPGVNCSSYGRFVGKNGSIEIGLFEMSNELDYVSGFCKRCCKEGKNW